MNSAAEEEALLIAEVSEMLNNEWEAQRYLAEKQQQELMQAMGDCRSIEGIGRLRMNITPEVYMHYVRRFGKEIWKQKDFLNFMEREHPETRVKCGGTRLQVGFTPAENKKRFTKRY
jgi:hypothetical protein